MAAQKSTCSQNQLPSNYRLGSVPYLNARPLVEAKTAPCSYAVPALLAREFAEGLYDAALLPAFEAVRGAEATLADGICIGSDGPVFSVFLAHREPLDSLASIALDPSSRTSSHLLQVVLSEFYEMSPDYTDSITTADQPRLLIGDPAIAFRQQHTNDGWQFLDLGDAWKKHTGLPFAFAIWMIHPSVKDPSALADHLRMMKQNGLAMRTQISSTQTNPDFAKEYLEKYILFDLSEHSKEALKLYATLLRKCGLVPAMPENTLHFV